jgi:hypothetical protein
VKIKMFKIKVFKALAIIGMIVSAATAQSLYPKEIEELSERLSNCVIAVGMAQHSNLMAAEKLADVDATKKLAQFYGQRVNNIMQVMITATSDDISISYADSTQTATSHYVRGAQIIKTISERTPQGYVVFMMKAITPNEAIVDVIRQTDKQMKTQPAPVQQRYQEEVRRNTITNAQSAFDELEQFMKADSRQKEIEKIKELATY